MTSAVEMGSGANKDVTKGTEGFRTKYEETIYININQATCSISGRKYMKINKVDGALNVAKDLMKACEGGGQDYC